MASGGPQTIYLDPVTVNSVSFNNGDPLPTGVDQSILTFIDGWDDTPDMDVNITEFGFQTDGGVVADFTPLRPRQMMLQGTVVAVDRATANNYWNQLILTAFPRNVDFLVTRAEPDYGKQITVRRVGPISKVRDNGNSFMWACRVTAGDPLKYSTTLTTNSAGMANLVNGYTYTYTYPLIYTISSGADNVSFNNVGNTDSYPIVTVTGPMDAGSWKIVNESTGEFLAADITLASTSDVLTVDMKNQKLTLNGSVYPPRITGSFWTLQPGQNVIKVYGDFDSSVTFTLYARSAWQ